MRGEKQKLSLPRPSFSKRDVDLVFLRSSLTFAKRSPSGNGAWMQIKLFFFSPLSNLFPKRCF